VKSPSNFGNDEGTKGSPTTKKPSFRIRWASIAIVSAIVSLSGWALSSPIGSSPDDTFHLPSIWCGQGFRDGLCEEFSDGTTAKVPLTTFTNSDCFAFNEEKSGKCTYDTTLSPRAGVNLLTELYPPVFYWSMSWFASSDVAWSTITIRIASAVFFVLATALVVAALPHHLKRVPIVTFLITSVPLGVFLIASTNPSGFSYISLILFFSTFSAFLIAQQARAKWILGALALLFSLIASGSRADASAFVVIAIGLAYLVSLSKKVFTPINAFITVLTILIAIYFYTSIGTAQSVVFSEGLGNPSVDPANAPGFFVTLAGLPNLWVGVFGVTGLGWLDTPMPTIVWGLSLGIFMALIFSAVRWFRIRQTLAVTASIFFVTAIPLYILVQSGLEVGQQVQPRYLLPLIALVAATALHRPTSKWGLHFTNAQVFIIGIGLFVSNSIALHLNTRRYVTGMDVMGVNLDEGIEWWWDAFFLSPNAVWFIATLASALMLISIWKLRHDLELPVESIEQTNFRLVKERISS
jgi:hypothetical protein